MTIIGKVGPTAYLAASLCLAAGSALADAASETVTAMTHANLAAQGSDIAAVHMHLHHTVNCLVGPAGAGFDAKELNPCTNAGNGAIPDTASSARKQSLQAAVSKAESGIAATDLASARKIAAATATMLK
jgi:hypothetical protein